VQEKILALAAGIAGVEADALLTALCAAAEDAWKARLREGVSPEDCGEAFCCAAAFWAAADYLVSRGGSGVESFTAGVVSIRGRDGGDTANGAQALRQAAQRLMSAYTEPSEVSLRSVRG
jgi:hypothetical protein